MSCWAQRSAGIARRRRGNGPVVTRAALWLAVVLATVGGCRCGLARQEGPGARQVPSLFAVGPAWVGDTSQTLAFGFRRLHTYSCKFKTLDTVCETLSFEPSPVLELVFEPEGLFTALDLGSGEVKVAPLAAGRAQLTARIRHSDGEEGVVQLALEARVPDAVRLFPGCEGAAGTAEVLEPAGNTLSVGVQVTGGDAGLLVSGLPPFTGAPFQVVDVWLSDAGDGQASLRVATPDGGAGATFHAEGFAADAFWLQTYAEADVTGVRVLLGGGVPDAGVSRSAPEERRRLTVTHLVGARPVCHQLPSQPRLLAMQTPWVCSVYSFPFDGGSFEVPPSRVLTLGLAREGECRVRAESPSLGLTDTLSFAVLP